MNLNLIQNIFKTEISLKTTSRRLNHIFFTIISSFLFLIFFEPFGIYYEDGLSSEEVFIELLFAMIIAFFVLLFTQIGIRNRMIGAKVTVIKIILWFLFETLFIAFIWTGIDIAEKPEHALLRSIVDYFTANVLVMSMPYFLFLFIVHHKDTLASSQEIIKTDQLKNISIKDQAGNTKICIETENLIYIQSADNYIEVHFIENGNLTKSLIRNTIKNIEPDLCNSVIIRCHRSYMVNTNNIEIATRVSTGFKLKMKGIADISIPVSKSFISEIKKHLNL